MVTRISLIAAVVLGLFLTGCGTPPRFSRIDARITDIKSTAHGSVLALYFINANTIPVVVKDASYTLFLNGQKLGVIESKAPVGIPALGTVNQDVTVPARMADALTRQTSAGSASWQLESTLNIEWADDTTAYKTASEGHLKPKGATAP